MKRNFKKYLFIIVFLIIPGIFSQEALIRPGFIYAADVPDMDMSATPNPVGSGARAIGIGGAFISVADDATAASWNPGGLLQLKKPEISMVGSLLGGKIRYKTSKVEGDIEDRSPDIKHLNYLSLVVPRIFFRRNFVFSLNYQHLYEFSRENFSTWRRGSDPRIRTDILHKDRKCQKGSLNTISPALAVQIIPTLFIGLTCNFWENGLLDNGWENITIQDEEGIEWGRKKIRHSEIYEKYDFSGFNTHLGFLFKSGYHRLWGAKRRFRIGGVFKSPFKADIRHEKQTMLYEKQTIVYEESVQDSAWSHYQEEPISLKNLTLKMPLSYGLGVSMDLSDTFLIALDVYRTHWEQYVLIYPSGHKLSPINKKLKDSADIKTTTQVRLGTEYIIEKPGWKIPLRTGAFYDPEPSGGRPDNFYGASFGTGIIYKELFSLDFAYQFRFGNKRNAEYMQNETISNRVTQHYFYASAIYYLF